MAMFQTLFLGFVLMIQSWIIPMFHAQTTVSVDYGGIPYQPQAIAEWLPLFEDGESDYIIVIADGAEKSIQTGARWLVEFIEEMTGAALDVVSLSALNAGDKFIALGNTGLDSGALDGDIAQLQNEGFVKRVIDDNVFICGIGRGTMYGCASFIEEQLGCRWFTPELKVIPKNPDLAIDRNLYSIQNTQLEYRDTYWAVMSEYPEFKAFHKMNSCFGYYNPYLGEEYGYGINFIDFCHSMERLLTYHEYFTSHPEYFSYNRETKTRTNDQRCLSNPDVLRIVTENTIARIAAAPAEGTIMSVSPNDNSRVCQCDGCLAVDAIYGGPSGTNIWFLNQVAEAVEEAFPEREVYIDTIAYWFTQPPPEISPRHNVIVRLCANDSCCIHPIDKCGHAKGESFFDFFKDKPSVFADYAEGWSKLCKQTGARLYIWEYTTNFKAYLTPFPNLHVFSNNIQYYIQNNVRGLFEQGDGDSTNGEFAELRAYIIAKLMWTPTLDVDHMMREFMDAYYGAGAAPYVREYLDAITLKAINTAHIYMSGRPEDGVYFSSSDLRKYDAIWDKAEKNAVQGEQLDNVRRSRLSLRHYKANMMKCEFSLLNPKRLSVNKELFHDTVMLGVNRMKEGDPIYEPYNTYMWWLRPIEWAAPLSWADFADKAKVVPMDLEAYRAEHR
ncbi:MAG: DUF4838 domain-containing protein [Oscillospiraceae bacterium]|nr:DUF4838 domain-containing protein [Oscillospiraceae bacterium]